MIEIVLHNTSRKVYVNIPNSFYNHYKAEECVMWMLESQIAESLIENKLLIKQILE